MGSGFKIEFLPQTKIVPAFVTTKEKLRKRKERICFSDREIVNKAWTLVVASCYQTNCAVEQHEAAKGPPGGTTCCSIGDGGVSGA